MEAGNGLDPEDVDTRIIRHSGTVAPSNFITQSNQLWIVFTTDDSKTVKGFQIEIKDNDLECKCLNSVHWFSVLIQTAWLGIVL